MACQGLAAGTPTNTVLAWNALMLDAIRAETTGPTLSTRNLAILHASIYDAVNAIDRRHQPYLFRAEPPPGTSPEAAAASAGWEVMRILYPSRNATTDALYGDLVAALPPTPETTNGIALGIDSAFHILVARAADGSATTITYIPSAEPGQWRRTPPYYRPPLDPQWRYVQLFCLDDKEPYVAPGPPALDSEDYARDFNEVQTLGAADSSLRTPEQSEIAVFWSDFSYTAMPPGHWHEIAAAIAADRQLGLIECARLMALLSLTEADAAIVCWEGKYRHNFWRPITAIQRADEDNNPATDADPAWDHFLMAPNFPEYPSGHSTFSKAGAQLLASVWGTDAVTFTVTSDSLPGVTRTFHSLAACADEVGMSRIYGGIHFQSANRDGKASGRKIADYVAANYLLPRSALPCLRLTGFTDGCPILRIHGEIGREYVVQATSDFVGWSNIGTVTAASGGVVCRDPAASSPQRFYRVMAR